MSSFSLSFDPTDLQRDLIHDWLREAYWTAKIRRDILEIAIDNSLCVGAYVTCADGTREQIGFARMVSDRATFAWLADVFVVESHRRRGVARAMTKALLDHPDLRTIRRFRLATKDAHGVYAALGFKSISDADTYMDLPQSKERWQE